MSTTIVMVEGRRLNSRHGDELDARLRKEWNAGTTTVVVDFAELGAADSLGLGALVRLLRAKPKDRKLVLRNVGPGIRSAMDLAQLSPLFDFDDTEEPGNQGAAATVS